MVWRDTVGLGAKSGGLRTKVRKDVPRVRRNLQRIGVLLAVLFLLIGAPLLYGCAGQASAAQPTVSTTLAAVVPSATITSAPATSITAAPSATTATVASAPTPAGTLQVHYIDVGQGDSELIISPEGKIMLIDGGDSDSGALAYLKAKGITQIDLMVATHPHADHVGGLVDVLDALPVKEVVTSGVSSTTKIYQNFLGGIARDKAVYKEVKQGDTLTLGSLEFSVLSADASLASKDMNQTSIVLRLVYGKVSLLFMGDAGDPIEKEMLGANQQVSAQILKVGHHGSSTASFPEFLAAVHPELAIYSSGLGNSFGHPAASTVTNLKDAGATVYGTDVSGTVVVTSDGSTYSVTCEKEGPSAPPAGETTEASPETSTTVASSGPLALKVVSLTSPIGAGSTANLTVKTAPGANCTITVYYKSGASKAAGLGDQTASESGAATWKWKVSAGTTKGVWKIVVTAEAGGQEQTIEIPFEVT